MKFAFKGKLLDHLPEMVLILAAAIFLAMGLYYTDRIPAWHEEISVHPSTGYRILEPDGLETHALPLAPWCGDPDPPRVVLSQSRPVFSLCFRGLTLPVMVSPYFTGIFYWPGVLLSGWHHGDVFLLRKLGLLVGLASLIQTYRLVARLADRATAALGALITSVTPAFIFAHSLLLLYEATPWLFLSTALLVLAGCPALFPAAAKPDSTARGLSSARLIAAAALLGLSVLANIKAVFLIVPLAAVAWRAGICVRRIRLWQWAAMLPAAVIPLLPILLFAFVDPRRGFREQVEGRLSNVLQHLHPRRFAEEVQNLLIHASDIGVFGDLAAGNLPRINYLGWVMPAIVLGWGTVALVKFARRPSGSPFAAACGGLLVTYLLVSVLLYTQYPAANYEPLHAVFGFAAAGAARHLGERIGRLLRVRAGPIGVAIGIAGTAPIAYNCYRAGATAEELSLPINSQAERELSGYLIKHSVPGEPLWTATYNYAGLFDSLGHGRLTPVQAHHVLLGTDSRRDGSSAEDEIAARFRRILADPRRLPFRLVLPVVITRVDEPWAHLLLPALHRAAAELHLAVELEKTFHTGAGVTVIALYKVTSRSPAHAVPAPRP